MAININPGSPLRHVATFNATGNWVAPAGTTAAFVSIRGSSGGGGGGGGRYNNSGVDGIGKTGGSGIVSGAWVQVTPGSSHSITIGAAGTGGKGAGAAPVPSATGDGQTGATGGTTIFDSSFYVYGGTGGQGGSQNYSPSVGNVGSSAGTTSLTALPPSVSTLTRVATISNQSTGQTTGGSGGAFTGRYNAKSDGTAGTAATVEIYI